MDNKKKINEMVAKLACAKCGAKGWECLGFNSSSCYHNEAIKEKVDLFNKVYDVNFEFRNYIDKIITDFEEIDKHCSIEKIKEKYGKKYIEKQEEIEDLKIDISDILEINHEDERFLFTLHTRNVLAEELVDKGYGNVKEAVKGFVDWIKECIHGCMTISNDAGNDLCDDIDEHFKKLYGDDNQ